MNKLNETMIKERLRKCEESITRIERSWDAVDECLARIEKKVENLLQKVASMKENEPTKS